MPREETKYTPTGEELAELRNIFAYHPADTDQGARYAANRDDLYELAAKLYGRCPKSAERTLAMRKLQEAMFFANAAIALHEKPAAEAKP